MLEDQDSDFILSIFLMEAWDTVASVEEGVRRLAEGHPASSDVVHPLVVVAHRLKGAAALHGYPVVSAVARAMEDLLEQLPGRAAAERARVLGVLAEVVKAIKRMLEMVGDDGREDVETVAGLRARFPDLFPAPAATDATPEAPHHVDRPATSEVPRPAVAPAEPAGPSGSPPLA